MKKIFTSTLLLIFISLFSFGQINTEGSEFWIDYHVNMNVGDLKLFIASPDGATVDISNNDAAYSNHLNIEAGALQLVVLPPTAYLRVNGVSSNTFHIVSDSKIAVYGVNYARYTTDAYVALPKESWGTEYRVATNTNFQHQISVIAGEDNTEVVVTDAAGNTLWGTTLMEGQVYYYATNNSLAGALVSSNNPVALFAGANCANLPGSVACDHLVEQLPPTSSFGQNFIVLPSGETDLGSGNADFVQIIANEDNTDVTSLTNGEFILNAGEERYYQFFEAEQIVANKPILVVQYGRGTYNGNGSYGDPMMMVIPPQDQFLKGYIVGAPQGFEYHFLNIVASGYSYTGITLDGVAISESEFKEVGESGYYGARIQVAEGNHTLESSMPFGVFSYGVNSANSYGYAGGMSLAPVASVNQVSISPFEQTVDVKVDGSVTATVLDSDENPMEGILVNFYISGIGDLQGGAYTDASGKAVYTYTRNDGGVDHIYAKVLNISSSTVDINWYEAPRVPVVVTNDISNVDSISATFNGIVTDIGHQDATQHGFCWGTTEGPGFDGEYSSLGAPSEGISFNDTVTGLSPATQYYVNTYAINDLDTVFGEQKAFVTTMIDQKASPATNVNCNSFTANWIKNSSATGYTLDISESADFSTYLVGYENKLISSNTIVSEDVSGLVNGKTYYYRVQGINSEYDLKSEYSATFSVVIEDNTPPVVKCKPITVYLDETGFASIAEDSIDNGSNDACEITFDTDTTEFSCSDVFETNIVTLKVTDASGNWSTCSSEVTVLDTVTPVVKCKPITVYLDETGFASIAEDSIDNGSNDACEITFDTDTTEFSCSDVFETNIVTLKVTDASGNWSTCSSEVTVLDTVTPGVKCKPITVYLDETGFVSISEDSIDNGSNDACGITFDTDTTEFSCSDVFETNIVTLKVTDASGNWSSCSSEVTVLDTIKPIVYCHDTTLHVGETGKAIIDPSFLDDGSYDICGVTGMSLSKTKFIGEDVGVNLVELSVTDLSGNVASCISKVTIMDTVPPVLSCQDIGINLNPDGEVRVYPGFVIDSIFDAGGIETYSLDTTDYNCSDLGEHTVVLTVADYGGNKAVCSAVVDVIDVFAPTVLCNDIELNLNEEGIAEIDVATLEEASDDVCGIAEKEISQSIFTDADLGVNKVKLYVTDISGNVGTCESTVIIRDSIAPVANCNPISVWLSAGKNYQLTDEDIAKLSEGSTDNATAFDNLAIEVVPNVFDCENIGDSVDVTVSVADKAGNVSTCETKVFVSYAADKYLEDIQIDLPFGVCETTIDYPDVFTDESCATLTLLDGLGADSIFPLGTTVETWEVVLDGVKDTVSFSVTVTSESTVPTIDTVADIVASEDENMVIDLKGISDGGDCIDHELSVTATSENTDLIENIAVDYTLNDTTAELEISLVANQTGEAQVVVLVTNEEGVFATDTFNVLVQSQNDAPVLVNPVADQEVKEGASLTLVLDKVPGEMFMDPDGDELEWSFVVEGDTVPLWMNTTETGEEFVFDFTPQSADTGCYNIIVVVEDTQGAIATDTVELCVLKTVTGVGDISKGLSAIKMYPNPTSGKVNIEYDSQSNDNIEIAIFSASGSEVLRKEFMSGDRIQFDLSAQVAGLYLVNIKQGELQVVKKLILDRK